MSDHKLKWEFEEIPRKKFLPRLAKGVKPKVSTVYDFGMPFYLANCDSTCSFTSGKQLNKEGAIKTVLYHMRKSHR